jgi:hypothetical protein
MQEVRIFCSRVLSQTRSAGFAVNLDDGSGVYIPASVVIKSGIKEQGFAIAKVIPNTHENNVSIPWVAVFVDTSERPDGEDLTANSNPYLDERVILAVSAMGYATTAEIADDVDVLPQMVLSSLLTLFRAGRLAKADVYATAGLQVPSFTIWATSAEEFTA